MSKGRASPCAREIDSLVDEFRQGKIGRRECIAKLVAVGVSASLASVLLGTRSAEAGREKQPTSRAKTVKKTVKLDPGKAKPGEVVDQLRLKGASRAVQEQVGQLTADGVEIHWTKIYTESHSNLLLDNKGQVLFQTTTPLTDAEMELIERLGLH
jgi:hypothetical protein